MALVGGVASSTLGLLIALHARGVDLGSLGMDLQKGHYQNQVLTMLLVGVLASIAALHLLQRSSYGWVGALASLTAFIGVALTVGGALLVALLPAMAREALLMVFGGLLVASAGILVLGIVTIATRTLPQWCGVALLVGSPPCVGIGFMVVSFVEVTLGSLGSPSVIPGDMGWGGLWVSAGAPWAIIGYAVFRAAGRRGEEPRPRVR